MHGIVQESTSPGCLAVTLLACLDAIAELPLQELDEMETSAIQGEEEHLVQVIAVNESNHYLNYEMHNTLGEEKLHDYWASRCHALDPCPPKTTPAKSLTRFRPAAVLRTTGSSTTWVGTAA